jgi:hypothetical protein
MPGWFDMPTPPRSDASLSEWQMYCDDLRAAKRQDRETLYRLQDAEFRVYRMMLAKRDPLARVRAGGTP